MSCQGVMILHEFSQPEHYLFNKRVKNPKHKQACLLNGLHKMTRVTCFNILILFQHLQPGCEVRVHWKGDPQLVLSSCTKYIDAKDELAAMNDDKV